MKKTNKNMARAVIAMVMVMVMMLTACGGNNTDTAPEKEQTIEMSNEVTKETEDSTMETEVETEVETEEETVVTDGEYAVYPAFIKTFTVTDNVLKVETESAFEDYEMPNEMAINFEYPLATDVVWTDNVAKITEEDDWFAWFSFYLEGIQKATERYNAGQYEGTYASGEDFCKGNAVWTFVIKDETVTSISMDLVKSEEVEATETETNEVETEATATETETKTETSPAPSAKEDTASTPTVTPTPVHTHSYNGTVTKQPTCGQNNGVKTFTCSCGDSYTESISGGDHNWTPIYGTVEHPSMGEMRQVQVGTSGSVYICGVCNAEFGSASDCADHKAASGDKNHLFATTIIRDGGPVYENQWVVTSEAWTETVVTGYQCATCGATK